MAAPLTRSAAAGSNDISPAIRSDTILRAAYDVIMDVGPRQATMTAIAKRAGMSRMTLYRRHRELDGLVRAVLAAELMWLIDQAAAIESDLPDADRMAATIAQSARGIAQHPLMSRIVTRDPEALWPAIVDRRGSTQRYAEERLQALLDDCQDGSITRANTQQCAQTIVTAALGFILSEAQDGARSDERWRGFEDLVKGYLTCRTL